MRPFPAGKRTGLWGGEGPGGSHASPRCPLLRVCQGLLEAAPFPRLPDSLPMLCSQPSSSACCEQLERNAKESKRPQETEQGATVHPGRAAWAGGIEKLMAGTGFGGELPAEPSSQGHTELLRTHAEGLCQKFRWPKIPSLLAMSRGDFGVHRGIRCTDRPGEQLGVRAGEKLQEVSRARDRKDSLGGAIAGRAQGAAQCCPGRLGGTPSDNQPSVLGCHPDPCPCTRCQGHSLVCSSSGAGYWDLVSPG